MAHPVSRNRREHASDRRREVIAGGHPGGPDRVLPGLQRGRQLILRGIEHLLSGGLDRL
jgi:hypothetical protein